MSGNGYRFFGFIWESYLSVGVGGGRIGSHDCPENMVSKELNGV